MERLKFCSVMLLWLFATTAVALPSAKVTIKVVDDQGGPVEGAEVRVGFESPGGYWQAGRIAFDSGYSDSDGIHVASSNTSGRIGYRIEKEGYYESEGGFSEFTGVSGVYGMRRWEPWNPILGVELRKIRNPIPLIVKQVEALELPMLNRPIGYDLMAGDWVVPFGQGTTADLVFTLEKSYQSRGSWKYKLSLGFANPDDGVIPVRASTSSGSQLLLAHHAPIEGYRSEYFWGKEMKMSSYGTAVRSDFGELQTDDLNFYFRVRSQRDEHGRLVSGIYGKIHNKFQLTNFKIERTGSLTFNYFLNPTPNDTNLEWDQKTNLFH
ncbi:hypothetical protein [Motiliproteus sp. SC1-56]|uniref:hypothetical protein n=1 Tax=Motiliproteus sp. SC1-56 TaxID=2799565 RepID=UPI001A8D5CD0|nr:hypothetical protein [Motiliproteus sp. SC1-56]